MRARGGAGVPHCHAPRCCRACPRSARLLAPSATPLCSFHLLPPALFAPLPYAKRLRRRRWELLLHLGLMALPLALLLLLLPPATLARRLIRLRAIEQRGYDHVQARSSDAAVFPPLHRIRLVLACVVARRVPVGRVLAGARGDVRQPGLEVRVPEGDFAFGPTGSHVMDVQAIGEAVHTD